ncbi:glycosyltransferase family 4 protein [Lonepinella sp. MS14435]|uniref:glycosyltransferase family 4 protein n=1 Tax=unclassified Lonepinella TaxID=2642006 RepID=UPI0036D75B19
MKKTVYVVTEYYHSTQNTTGYLFEKLCNALSKDDELNLKLIVTEDGNIPKQDNAIYVRPPIKKNRGSLIKRALFEVMLSFAFLSKIFSNVSKNDIVFSATTPTFLLVVIAVLQKMIGFKWILLVHDVFPENLVPARILKSDQFFYKILKKIFDRVYAKPDRVIVIGKDMQELVSSKTNKDNIDIVQNWIDESDILVQKRSDNDLLKNIGWEHSPDTIFYYFGNIGRMQGIDTILDAVPLMKHNDKAKFLFVGEGAYVEQLKNKISNMNNPNVHYYGSIGQSNKSLGLNTGDIALVTLAEGMLGLGVPSKTYFSMAADKPVLAILDQRSEVADMVNRHKTGWTIDPKDTSEIAQLLDEIVLLDHQYNLNSPRAILQQYYSESTAVGKIIAIIKKI